jgi:hypothetical protein
MAIDEKSTNLPKVSNTSMLTRPNPLEIPDGQNCTQAYQGWGTRKSLLMALSVNDLLNAPIVG